MRDLKRPNAKLPAFRQLSEAGFEVFTPLKQHIYIKRGKKIRETVPVIRDLLFVNSDRNSLDIAVMRTATLQYRYVKGAAYCQPLIVPGRDMERFIRLTSTADKVEYYSPEEIKPSMLGSKIRLIDQGPLNGLEGILLSMRGSKKRRLLVEVPGILAAAVEINPDFIELI